MIFVRAPRLELDGFRWAISTFLSYNGGHQNPLREGDRNYQVRVGDKGLRGTYLVLKVSNGSPTHIDSLGRLLIAGNGCFAITLGDVLESDFHFTHISCPSSGLNDARRSDEFTAAAVLEDRLFLGPEGVDIVATFKRVVNLTCFDQTGLDKNEW